MTTHRSSIAAHIQAAGLVAIIRAPHADGLIPTCRALAAGGIKVAEITLNSPGALPAIAAIRAESAPDFLIGAGTVLDAPSARDALDAGAQFIVAPTFNPAVLAAAHDRDKPVLPGAFTPTEILAAWQAGADFVKVFPANHFGPDYLREVLAPLPDIKLLPTGGVNLQTLSAWFTAGAACLGVGTSLVNRDLVARKDWQALTDLANQYTQAAAIARHHASS
jgi:2-dehydro-3-deoxyphosphogluconate aldolase/(4S)-4-hydroxy-2-oxoglutarate aldolase